MTSSIKAPQIVVTSYKGSEEYYKNYQKDGSKRLGGEFTVLTDLLTTMDKHVNTTANPWSSSLKTANKVVQFMSCVLLGLPYLIAYIHDKIFAPDEKTARNEFLKNITPEQDKSIEALKDKRIKQTVNDLDRKWTLNISGLSAEDIKLDENNINNEDILQKLYEKLVVDFDGDKLKAIEFLDFLQQGVLAESVQNLADYVGNCFGAGKSKYIVSQGSDSKNPPTLSLDLKTKTINFISNLELKDGDMDSPTLGEIIAKVADSSTFIFGKKVERSLLADADTAKNLKRIRKS